MMKLSSKTSELNLYYNFLSKSLGMLGIYEITLTMQLEKNRRYLKKIIKKYSKHKRFIEDYRSIMIFKKFYY